MKNKLKKKIKINQNNIDLLKYGNDFNYICEYICIIINKWYG